MVAFNLRDSSYILHHCAGTGVRFASNNSSSLIAVHICKPKSNNTTKCGRSGWFSNVKLKSPLRMKVAFWLVGGWTFYYVPEPPPSHCTSLYLFIVILFQKQMFPPFSTSIRSLEFKFLCSAKCSSIHCAHTVRPRQFTLRNENMCPYRCVWVVSILLYYYLHLFCSLPLTIRIRFGICFLLFSIFIILIAVTVFAFPFIVVVIIVNVYDDEDCVPQNMCTC